MPRFELKLFWSGCNATYAAFALLASTVIAVACCWHQPQEPPRAELPGEQPPVFVSGLPDDWFEVSREVYAEFPEPFQVAEQREDLRRKTVYLWDAVLQVESPRKPRGQHYTSGPQLTGSCVAWGGCTAKFYTLANAVVAGNASGVDDPCQPVSYGITRVTQGRGRPRCGQQGAYPIDFARGFQQHGWVTWREANVGAYSRAMEDRLGCTGPTAEQLRLAKARAGGDCHPIRRVDELLEALHNGYAGTAAFTWSPGRTRSVQGRIVTEFDGTSQGGHQVAWVGWDGERQQCVFHNSHGPDRHPRNEGDPPGSFRVTLATLEWMLRTGEFWALSSVTGFPPQELDFSPLRPRPRP